MRAVLTYQPGETLLHGLHPAVKLLWLLSTPVGVFVFDSTTWPMLLALAATGLLWTAGVAPWRIPGVRSWTALGLGIVLLSALVVREGAPILGPVTDAGLLHGLRAAGRLLTVVLFSTLFVVTTEPAALACALMKAGLPDRWGFALVTAMRWAPLFRVESQQVYRAQLLRGAAYDVGRLRRWWLLPRHLFLPVLVSALRTAQALSLSMEGRSFGLYPRRTFLREVHFRRRDLVAVLLLLLLAAGALGHCRGGDLPNGLSASAGVPRGC